MKMLSELDPSLDQSHIVIKNVLCSFSKQRNNRAKSSMSKLYRVNIVKLQKIYQNNFRHQYSKLFLIISTIDKHLTLNTTDLLQTMDEFIDYIKRNESAYSINFKKDIYKLYDHVVLEILQIRYMGEIENKGDANNLKTICELNNARNLAENARKRAVKATIKIDNMQKEYITILGIFASIIIAFVATLSFSTSVLQNIDKPNTLKLVAIICFLGVFIVNILNLLFNFVREIHFGKEDNKDKKHWLKLCIFNAIIIIIALVCLYLALGYDEKHPSQKDNNSTINFHITAPRF